MGASSSSSSSRVVDDWSRPNQNSTQASSNTNAMNASSINTLPTERSNYSSGVIYEYRAPNRTGLSTSSTYQTSAQRPSAPLLSTPSMRQSPTVIVSSRTWQLEDVEFERAIQHSLRENYNTSLSRPSNVAPSPLSSSTLSQQRTNIVTNINQPKIPAKAPAPKGEMAFDCSICMSNEHDVIVATECGHVFHKECVTPWIQQAGTCPSCRVRVTIVSLRKIFIPASSSGKASTSNATKPQTNGNNNRNNNNSNNKNNVVNRRRPNTNRNSLSPTMFNRSIWLSSTDKNMTEQSLAIYISSRFHFISPQQVLIKSLKKAGVPQRPPKFVSFKIDVDTENTYNTILDITKWPRTFRVREFIQRN